MATNVYLLTLFMMLGTVLLVFGMRYYVAARQAKATVASADAYRELAAKAAAAQTETATLLASVQTSLSEINARLASVERILKDVG